MNTSKEPQIHVHVEKINILKVVVEAFIFFAILYFLKKK